MTDANDPRTTDPVPRVPASLGKRAISGSVWSVLGFGLTNAIRLGSNLLLTRLLAPDAFGVMAITSGILTWLNMLSDFGVKPSLIRSDHGDKPEFQATARSIQAGRGLGIAALLVLASLVLQGIQAGGGLPPDSVYQDERLPHFLQLIGLGTAVQGVTSIRMLLLERRLSLLPAIKLDLTTQVIGVGIILALAYNGFGAYSLPVGTAAGMVARTIGSYLLVDGEWPVFRLHRDHMKEIIGYGKWLIVASFLGFVVNRGGDMIMAYLVDRDSFSLYAIGVMWVATVRQLVLQIVQKVGYPMFSEVSRERPKDGTRIYYRVRLFLDSASVALFLAAIFLSQPFFDLLYTEPYQPVAGYVRLCAVGLLLLPYNLLNTVILSSGDSRRFTFVTGASALATAIGTPLIHRAWGFEPAIVFVALAPAVALPVMWTFARRVIRLNPLREALLLGVAVVAVVAILSG